MTDENPSIISHVSIGTNRFDEATAFYDKVVATIGAKRIMEHPGAVAYGTLFPEFWVQTPHDGGTAGTANGVHFSFFATSKEQVDAFYKAALDAGAKDDGAAGPRSDYGAGYYGCFVYDLDGHKIEAMHWDESAG
tara:strand:- start:1358 stop:1762 length:405 start_codon:yes stop_codon:yes gene_type:complete